MRKKKKHGQSSRLHLIAAGCVAVILLLIGIILPLFMDTTINVGYATQPWTDPANICPTEWVRPEYDRDNPQLMNAFDAENLSVDEVLVISTVAMPTCYDTDGTAHHVLNEIFLDITVDDDTLSDPEQIGILIHNIIAASGSTEISEQWSGLDILTISFYLDESRVRFWRMNYQEALRAYEEGLTGAEMYGVGIIRELESR